MKRFFTKTGIWLLAAAATIAVVLCVVSALGSGTGLLHNALGVIASPFRAAGSAVAGWVDGINDRFDSVEALQQENEELRQQIAELEKQLRSAESAAEENRDLRELLGLRQQRSDLTFEAARVTQRDVSNWASTLVLNRGSQHGVAVGNCAVDSAGNLAGVITEVGLNWSRLATVLDTESQFGATVFRTGETAVAGGELELMAEGKLRLQYLADSASLIKGDVVVTSGLGGYYPSGLVIGTVEAVQTDDGGLARYAVLVHVRIWGVHPFILPAIAVIPATLERGEQGLLYGAFFGLACDLLTPVAGMPCFYFLVFLLGAAAAWLLSGQVIMAGVVCSVAVTAVCMVICALLHAAVMAGQSGFDMGAASWLALRELAVSLPFAAAVHPLLAWVRTRALDD